MQATINQIDHDRLIKQKIEGNRCYKSGIKKRETGKKITKNPKSLKKNISDPSKRKNIDWADRQCKQCISERIKESSKKGT